MFHLICHKPDAWRLGSGVLHNLFEVPLNFVIPAARQWPELADGSFTSMTDEDRACRALSGLDNWVIAPYQYFLSRGMNVSQGTQARSGYVNVLSGMTFAIRDCSPNAFIVVCRADAHYPAMADFIIEQNRCRLDSPRTAYLPHPALPGLVPRDATRQGLRTLAYKGLLANLDSGFHDARFHARLAELGISLRLDTFETAGRRIETPAHDFSDVDAVLAVRNLTEEDARGKPANKLVNAWRAGVPALLGPEPAYRELRRSDLDYFEVRTPDEAIACLTRLVNDPDLYRRMSENGLARAAEFTEERIYGLWPGLFNGEILEAYRRWQRRSLPERMLRFAWGVVQEKRARRAAARYRVEGRRILDD